MRVQRWESDQEVLKWRTEADQHHNTEHIFMNMEISLFQYQMRQQCGLVITLVWGSKVIVSFRINYTLGSVLTRKIKPATNDC